MARRCLLCPLPPSPAGLVFCRKVSKRINWWTAFKWGSYSPDYVGILVVASVWVAPSTVHHAGIDIGRTKRVGFVEQWDNREEDGADVLCWIPSLARQLAALRIIDGRVQDGDAQVAVLVDVRVPNFCDETDRRRRVRIVCGELHERLQKVGRKNPLDDGECYFRIDFSSRARFWKIFSSVCAARGFLRCRKWVTGERTNFREKSGRTKSS